MLVRVEFLLTILVLGATAGWAAEPSFENDIQPFLTRYCHRCHNADDMQSGIRVDQFSADNEDRHIPMLQGIRKQVADGVMPPEDEPQPSAEERKRLDDWLGQQIHIARSRVRAKNGIARRLTVTQYRHTLRDLLGITEDLTDSLPPDAVSKDGFTNNAAVLALSPLQVETYFDIAAKALDQVIVDERAKPTIQHFRVEFGRAINPAPCPDKLILGANSELLDNGDFIVSEPSLPKSFEFTPFQMKVKHDFIEGYVGNDTIRQWRHFDSVYHSVFACMRGTPGYPKGLAYQTVPAGLLLRPAIPSPEIFGDSNTYGPMANFKISLRELPDEGNFRVTVKAAKVDDGLLLDKDTATLDIASANAAVFNAIEFDATHPPPASVTLPHDGVYQVDVHLAAGKPAGDLHLQVDEHHFAGSLNEPKEGSNDIARAFLVARWPAGERKLAVRYGDNTRLRKLVFHRLADDHPLGKRFVTFERRVPTLGVHLGLRRDCGSTLTQVGQAVRVADGELGEFRFDGAINDFPAPAVEKDNVNYLAGIREIAVRSEYTDGRDMPRLLIRSVEFEGPFYDAWPPATHRRIFIDSPRKDQPPEYAREILASFAASAYRRPATDDEVDQLVGVWKSSYETSHDFSRSIKDALLVVLTSPQFLFLIEHSATPEAEDLSPHELASKLSYFLWNAPPDGKLLELAARGALRESLDAEIDRMIADPRFEQFVSEFASQWLSLDKFEVVSIDAKRYPTLTRDTKTELRKEPVQFLRHVFERNLPARTLIASDFVMANETTASYYGLGEGTEQGMRFVPITLARPDLGGLLSQASILSGLSDGRESNPVKRGAWLARRIIAQPPDDPPPNVPKLPEDPEAKVSLREKLELHRNQKGCAKCHGGIDPWGLPLEAFDAGGLLKREPVDTRAKLPDGTEVADFAAFRKWLAEDQIDQIAFSLLKHLSTYAIGRSLTYNEVQDLRQETVRLRPGEYKTQDLLRHVIKSDVFLKK